MARRSTARGLARCCNRLIPRYAPTSQLKVNWLSKEVPAQLPDPRTRSMLVPGNRNRIACRAAVWLVCHATGCMSCSRAPAPQPDARGTPSASKSVAKLPPGSPPAGSAQLPAGQRRPTHDEFSWESYQFPETHRCNSLRPPGQPPDLSKKMRRPQPPQAIRNAFKDANGRITRVAISAHGAGGTACACSLIKSASLNAVHRAASSDSRR